MRYETALARQDGTEVKIITETNECPMYGKQWDLFVLKKEIGETEWKHCSKTPPPTYKEMSLEEYLETGRSEMLRTIRPSELVAHMKMVKEREAQREQELALVENTDLRDATGGVDRQEDGEQEDQDLGDQAVDGVHP